jgi:hypothetical protein
MKAFLMVTWIIAGQPPSSYQTPFATMEACQAARIAVIQDADRLNAESDKKSENVANAVSEMSRRLILTGTPPDVAISTAQRYYQVQLTPHSQAKVSAVCAAQ